MAGIPPIHEISFIAGDDVTFTFQVADRDPDAPLDPPVPRDLSGWSVLSQIRTVWSSDTVTATWETEPLGSDGIIAMSLDGDVTQPWAVLKKLASDVQLTDPSGERDTILGLVLKIKPDVSRE